MVWKGWLLRKLGQPSADRTICAEFAAAGLALGMFVWLAFALKWNHTLWFDTAIRQAVQRCGSPLLTLAMRYITNFGQPAFLVPFMFIVVLWLLVLRRYRAAMALVVLWSGATALSETLKLLFRRVRPEAFFGYTEPITYSFPSGHAIASACFYGVVAAVIAANGHSAVWRAAIWGAAFLIVMLIGFSRIYLGVHYLSDVIAGYAIAVFWVVLVRTLFGFH
jgi:membrane-associated phospholipid phosphatase